MGWFWGSSDNSNAKDDPYSKLDPGLREFLEKESPLKYETAKPKPSTTLPIAADRPSSDGPRTSYRSEVGIAADAPSQTPKSLVPEESLYQDGRYAHLWATYQPQSTIDASQKSDQDRLADVVASFQSRKAAIGRAAMENCIEYQIAEQECFKGGLWRKGVGMCRTEGKAFGRCYEMQQRFLKALGYLSNDTSTDEEEERIQMHADKLYHEMLARERLAGEAKQAGAEVGAQKPLFGIGETSKALGVDSVWARSRKDAPSEELILARYEPRKQAELLKKLDALSPAERELELQSMASEASVNKTYAAKIEEISREEAKHRAERRERGKETVGDTIKRLWGWDKER